LSGSIAVPGVVAGMEEAHRRHARLPWKELLSPAVDLGAANQVYSELRALKVDLTFAIGGIKNHEVYFEHLGGSGGDPFGNAQNVHSLLGKLLRIDVNGAQPYAIPPTNPFAGRTDARPEIWAYGLRNPWRFSFDRMTGDLWIADVGQDLWEEIDLQPATSAGGVNYGWSCLEATHSFNPAQCRGGAMTMPILEYHHDDGACSVTGGYRYGGSLYPRFRGMFFYADFCTGVISALTQQSNGSWKSQTLFDAPFNVSTFGEDSAGEIYVADYNGTIYQITDSLPFNGKRHAARH